MGKPLIVYNKVPILNKWLTNFWWLFGALRFNQKLQYILILINVYCLFSWERGESICIKDELGT